MPTGLASECDLHRSRPVEAKIYPLSAVRGKVLLFQNPAVMQFMAGKDVGKGADRDFILVGHAATRPGRLVKIPQQRHSRPAHGDEVFNPISQGPLPEGAVADVVVLLKTFQGRRIVAGDT